MDHTSGAEASRGVMSCLYHGAEITNSSKHFIFAEMLRDKINTGRSGLTCVYTTTCKTDSYGKLLYRPGSSAQCSVMTEMGGMRSWEGGSRGRGSMYTHS